MDGRHPSLEQQDSVAQVVPNDVRVSMKGGERCCSIVTGPNMGGKSSYVRMVAVLSIMAQVSALSLCKNLYIDFLDIKLLILYIIKL